MLTKDAKCACVWFKGNQSHINAYNDQAFEVLVLGSIFILTCIRHQHLKYVHQRAGQVTLTCGHQLLQLKTHLSMCRYTLLATNFKLFPDKVEAGLDKPVKQVLNDLPDVSRAEGRREWVQPWGEEGMPAKWWWLHVHHTTTTHCGRLQ